MKTSMDGSLWMALLVKTVDAYYPWALLLPQVSKGQHLTIGYRIGGSQSTSNPGATTRHPQLRRWIRNLAKQLFGQIIVPVTYT